jgi:hypothetical protein
MWWIIAACQLWRRSRMRTGVIIALMTISTVAFAGDARMQANVYDDFRGRWKPSSPEATVDEEVTATIKRHMANLLYPVDMSSFKGPDNDTKFRDLIKVLQQQMGAPPTGVLTVEQFYRLAEASRYLDGEFIGFQPSKIVWMSENSMVGASGTGAMNGTEPLNVVRILCLKERGTCEMYNATFRPESRFLLLDLPTEYQIDVWTPSRVTARDVRACSTALMTIDIKGEQVVIVTLPEPDSSLCAGASSSPETWKLIDGFPVVEKLNQDKMNEARVLVYPPGKRLLPIQK